jgi:hypothetical protein
MEHQWKQAFPLRMALILTSTVLLLGNPVHAEERAKPKSLGIDPTEVIGRIGVNYTFIERNSGTLRHSALVGFSKALTDSSNIGINVPFTVADIEGAGSKKGLGNIGLRASSRFYHADTFSALVGARLLLNTATDDALGDDTLSGTLGLSTAWRKKKMLYALSSSLGLDEDSEQNSISLSPFIGYQPMNRYISYLTLGPSFSQRLEENERFTTATIFAGKVMPNMDIFAAGTRFTIDGEDQNKSVILLSYRRIL